jgi:hypothetical protein
VELKRSISCAVLLSALVLTGFGLAGCNEDVEVIRDPEIHLAKGMTWAWRPANMPEDTKLGPDGRPIVSRDVIKPTAPPPTQRLESNRDWNTEANRTQLQQAIEHALTNKGFRLVTDPTVADILVDYHVAVKTQNATVGYPGYPGYGWGYYGPWGGWGWGPPEVYYQNVRFHVGTFVLDLALRNPRKLAYRAISHKTLNNKPQISPYQAEEAVNHLLKDLKPQ